MNPDIFALDGKRSLLDETHFGIINGAMTLNVLYRDVCSFRGLYAPPYGSTDFICEGRICGEKVPMSDYTWHPYKVERQGLLNGLEISSKLVLPADKRSGILAITIHNTNPQPAKVPIQFTVRGGFGYESFWEFGWPKCEQLTNDTFDGSRLVKSNEAGAVVMGTDIENIQWLGYCCHWEGEFIVQAGETVTKHIGFALGKEAQAMEDCNSLLLDAVRTILEADQKWSDIVDDLFTRIPKLEASDERLVKWYNRSVLALIINQWHIPDLILNPYYSTGGMIGGCVCSYLWDFGEIWEMFPIYDPASTRSHIKQFLVSNITQHFAFTPVTGEPFGPWYPVNQEKIIHLIYYYVLFTGDQDFLQEMVADKSVIDHVLLHATYRDDITRPVALIDYGNGNNHLELRKSFRYDNFLPDLNGRRCANYKAAAQLCKIAGKEYRYLLDRAEELKQLVKEKMWNPDIKWFNNLDINFGRQTRYTIQMYKMIAGGSLDTEELEGLISHLNEEEFLSEYGLHSMSKQDESFDQIDIDNGGGGNYTGFPPMIMEKLYRVGRPEVAEDILERILWWGERLPYWGDSIVANHMDYRKDTPLQNTISAAAAAQSIIFGMLGVTVDPDGTITVNPSVPDFSPELKLTGLKLRGRTLDISANQDQFEVTVDGIKLQSTPGKPLIIPV